MAVWALIFDVFGTVVDWRSGIARDVSAAFALKQAPVDAEAFADAWRGEYQPAMARLAMIKPTQSHGTDGSAAGLAIPRSPTIQRPKSRTSKTRDTIAVDVAIAAHTPIKDNRGILPDRSPRHRYTTSGPQIARCDNDKRFVSPTMRISGICTARKTAEKIRTTRPSRRRTKTIGISTMTANIHWNQNRKASGRLAT